MSFVSQNVVAFVRKVQGCFWASPSRCPILVSIEQRRAQRNNFSVKKKHWKLPGLGGSSERGKPEERSRACSQRYMRPPQGLHGAPLILESTSESQLGSTFGALPTPDRRPEYKPPNDGGLWVWRNRGLSSENHKAGFPMSLSPCLPLCGLSLRSVRGGRGQGRLCTPHVAGRSRPLPIAQKDDCGDEGGRELLGHAPRLCLILMTHPCKWDEHPRTMQ